VIKKSIVSIIFIIIFSASCIAEIMIIKTEGIIAYDLVIKGINQNCKEKNAILNLKKDLSNEQQIIEQSKNVKSSVSIILGDEAADFASRNLKNKAIVYSMVLQTKKYNFDQRTTFGLDILISIDQVFSYLQQINKGYKNIGLIYEPGQNEILAKYAGEAAKKENLNLISKGIKSAQDISAILNELLPQVQVIMMIPSDVTMTPEVMNYVSQKALEKNIPVVGLAESYLQYGALFTVSINPIIIGNALGQVACLILKGESITNIKVVNPAYSKISLNLNVAELLQLNIPAKMKESAYKTIK